MKKELMEYFKNLKEENLPVVSGKFVEDGIRIRKFNNKFYDVNHGNVFSYLFNDDLMCVKSFFYKQWQTEDIFEIISGDYFNDSGILSVVGYPVEFLYKLLFYKEAVEMCGVATHNLKALSNIEIIEGKDLLFPSGEFDSSLPSDNWFMLEDSQFRSYLQSLMTKECFDEYLNLFLADKVGGYVDRNGGNYFFYKRKGSPLYEGVIAIDNGLNVIGRFTDDSRFNLGIDNKNVITEKYWHYNAHGSKKMCSHAENIYEINRLLDMGKFGDSQVETLKKVLQFPYEENMKNKCAKYGFSGNYLYDNTARLWNYNRENLSM